MRKISRRYPRLAVWLLLMAILAACGNRSTTSTTAPAIFNSHSVAFNNGTLYEWGVNTYGQLGNGDTNGNAQLFPIPIAFTNVSGVSAGGTHTLAFKKDGTVWAWGNNGFGQLGNNSTNLSFSPIQVFNLKDVTAVTAGFGFSLALKSDQTVWAWGDNEFGQLGNTLGSAPVTPISTPVQVVVSGGSPLTSVTKIAAGGAHSLAISNGTAYAWGYNGFGQLGQQISPPTAANGPIAAPVTKSATAGGGTLTNVIDIAAGGSHSLFIVNDGTLWACGYNRFGQLGVGDATDRNLGVVPVIFPAITATNPPIQVAAGLDHSLALLNDGTVWAWGYNFSGQLGNGAALGSIDPVATPGQVKKFDGAFLTGVTKIVAIGNHNLALDSSGQLWAWGDNTFGQLGNGTKTSSSLAIMVSTPTLAGWDLYHP